jgi:hypothetical protein
MTDDPYDFRAPGFTPDEYNSLLLQETAGTMGARSSSKRRPRRLWPRSA